MPQNWGQSSKVAKEGPALCPAPGALLFLPQIFLPLHSFCRHFVYILTSPSCKTNFWNNEVFHFRALFHLLVSADDFPDFAYGTEQGRKKKTHVAQGACSGLHAFTSWCHQVMPIPRAVPATRVVQRQALVGVSCSSPYPISLLLPHRMPSVRTEESTQPNSEHLHPRLARTRLLTSPRWEACVGKGARIRGTSQAKKVWGACIDPWTQYYPISHSPYRRGVSDEQIPSRGGRSVCHIFRRGPQASYLCSVSASQPRPPHRGAPDNSIFFTFPRTAGFTCLWGGGCPGQLAHQ